MRRRYLAVVSALAFFSLFALWTGGCSKFPRGKKGEAEGETEGPSQSAGETDKSGGRPIAKELEDLLARSKPIKEFTPELFVALTIEYQRASKKWLEDSKSLAEVEQKRYLDGANRAFFVSYGTTEDAYVQYSQSHIEELNTYMSSHPELMKDLVIED